MKKSLYVVLILLHCNNQITVILCTVCLQKALKVFVPAEGKPEGFRLKPLVGFKT